MFVAFVQRSVILFSIIGLFLIQAWAAVPPAGNTLPQSIDPTKAQAQPKLEFMKNFKGKNQIKLLNNRFRVDYEVDEIMLLFFRKHGSAPVVLVQPDGSKIYPRDADGETIEWHADVSYDLIKLTAPMAGPWQAIGRILPDSKILVLSDIELQADKLPDTIFQYEVIKAKARIVNADEMIRDGGFRNVVRLKANLYSTNDAEQANFGADIFRLGEFLDNGKDLDEKPRDGVFTVKYYIDTATGNWLPKYRVTAELFTRELEQETIEVLPNPISFNARVAEPGERYHYVDILVDETHIENAKLSFQGSILLPNGETHTFNLAEVDKRELQIFQNDYGSYRINMEVFGFDKTGRDIVLKLPEFDFLTEEPEIELPPMTDASAEAELLESEVELVAKQKKKEEVPIALIVIINLVILIMGFLVIWLFVLNKNIPNPLALLKRKKKQDDPVAPEKKEEKAVKKAPQDQSSDDILDLSLPED